MSKNAHEISKMAKNTLKPQKWPKYTQTFKMTKISLKSQKKPKYPKIFKMAKINF